MRRTCVVNITYGFGKVVGLPFDQAIERVTQLLRNEGFGVLTDIDVAATFKKKLGKDISPYRILGACNPTLADRAIALEPSIGLLLPCNVLVRQDEKQQVHVEFMDPIAVLALVQRADVEPVAREVRARLERILEAL
ncbi:ABC transporter ATP-binding protein [Steroidobacter denitrificans]|uniref:ABC transporter ATP-binding protein n=1 Tax=Steroidobacter denitrificans TaxID=465721 RepID=A0A127FB22_STEDE|nr:ABC transporter ATP-binding protein [Steroidobacter denitrificans]